MIATAWWSLIRRSEEQEAQLKAEQQATIEQERAAFDRERAAARQEAEQAAERRMDYESRVRVLKRRVQLQTREHYDTG